MLQIVHSGKSTAILQVDPQQQICTKLQILLRNWCRFVTVLCNPHMWLLYGIWWALGPKDEVVALVKC